VVRMLAERHGVEMPICREVADIIENGKPPQQAVSELLARDLREEGWHAS